MIVTIDNEGRPQVTKEIFSDSGIDDEDSFFDCDFSLKPKENVFGIKNPNRLIHQDVELDNIEDGIPKKLYEQFKSPNRQNQKRDDHSFCLKENIFSPTIEDKISVLQQNQKSCLDQNE